MEISRLNFSCYEREDETFLFPVPVVDETWVHSCEPDLVAIKRMVSQKITMPMKMLTGTGSAEVMFPVVYSYESILRHPIPLGAIVNAVTTKMFGISFASHTAS
jgi:hypothetical protein